METRIIGKGERRVDAFGKVTGRAKFASDYNAGHQLYGKVLRSEYYLAGLLGLGPVQVLVEEVEAADAVDGVAAVEELDGSLVANAQVVVEAAHFGVLAGDPFVQPNRVAVAALDHEWARRDERGHLRMTEGLAQVEVRHLVFAEERVAGRRISGDRLPGPIVEAAGADGQGIAVKHRRNAQGRQPAIGQAVEADAAGIHEWQRAQPVEDAAVLRDDHREEGGFERIRLALQLPELVFAAVGVVRGKDYEAAVGQARGVSTIVVERVILGVLGDDI